MDFVDSYTNVTLDTVSVLKFVKAWPWANGVPDYIIVGDDDTYVNVPNLWSLLYVEGKMKPVRERPTIATTKSCLEPPFVGKKTLMSTCRIFGRSCTWKGK